MKVAIYARVSTTDQHCEMQLKELREYAARRAWEVAGEYVDTGWSGAKASRPQLNALMAAAKLRQFDAVAVWKLDRWGRSVLHLSESLRTLKSHGVSWIAVTQGLDTSDGSPTANLLLNILAAVAEFEREMTRERAALGSKLYRDLFYRGLVGKERCSRSKKNLAPHRPPAVFDRKRAAELQEAGQSVRAIASLLGVPRSVVGRFLVSLKASAKAR
jgi:DNA invertase Pin-like site-specific DNA recombinase